MLRHHWLKTVFLLLTVTVCASAADTAPSPTTGFQRDVHVTAPTRIDWQFVIRSIGDTPDDDDKYDSRQQRYQLFVPKNYNAAKAWPLVVNISPIERAGWRWPNWRKPCEELGMLYCEAENAGNSCETGRRARIVLDMLDDVRRHYRIDPHQTYITGESGGGRMACLIGYALPEYFAGVAPICGTSPLPPVTYLRHRVHDRQSVAFITGSNDFNRDENKDYMAPMFKDLGIRSKLWLIQGMSHQTPKPEILTEVLQWLAKDLPRRQSDAEARPGLAITPNEAPTGEHQAAGQLETARSEAKHPERIWQAAALAQGVLDRWEKSPSAGPAQKFLEELRADPQRAALLAQQRSADEWLARSARARAREQFHGKTQALKDWQALAKEYANTPEGKKAEAEAKRLETAITNLPRLPFLGIGFTDNTPTVGQVVKGGPAHKAGLQPDDVIVKFDGNAVETREELMEHIKKHKPGDKVLVEVQRDDKPVKVTIEVGVRQEGGLPAGW